MNCGLVIDIPLYGFKGYYSMIIREHGIRHKAPMMILAALEMLEGKGLCVCGSGVPGTD